MEGSRAWRVATFALIALMGCEQLPEPKFDSEHAAVGTEIVDDVCAGTLARIDRTIEYIDATLGHVTGAEPVHIYIVDAAQLEAECGDYYGGCSNEEGVILRPSTFEHGLTHELVHDRVWRELGHRTKGLFSEGIAMALGMTAAPPSDPDHAPPSVGAMLEPRAGGELLKVSHGYFYAGELLAWLIEVEGMPATLALMAELEQKTKPARVRERYTAHFGRRIDDDLFVHVRDEADMSPYNVGCDGLELEPEPGGRRVRLQAELACDAERVESVFDRPGHGYVEWIIRVDEADAGWWAPVRLSGDERLPADTFIEVNNCTRAPGVHELWTVDDNAAVSLPGGVFRIRWYGPVDEGASLDLELGGPCELEGRDCGPGEVCILPGVCVPQAD